MKRALPLLLPLLLAACATVAPEAPPAVKAELAPTGTLRAALLAPNPVFVTQNTPPGVVKGMAVEIANRLALRLGVTLTPVLYPSVAPIMEAARKGEWDITFLPVDPERADLMNFTAPYLYGESTFLLPAGSAAASLADLDRPGKTIVAVARSTQEAWLRANVKSATIVAASSPLAAQQMIKDGKVDAYASLTTLLAGASRQIPGSRLLPGSFSDSPIAMAVVKVRPAADAFAYEFIDQLKASGAIQELIARENLTGVRAAR
jgi:polar amino acid transport system substrate-binding protein